MTGILRYVGIFDGYFRQLSEADGEVRFLARPIPHDDRPQQRLRVESLGIDGGLTENRIHVAQRLAEAVWNDQDGLQFFGGEFLADFFFQLVPPVSVVFYSMTFVLSSHHCTLYVQTLFPAL